jgi:ATP-dependent Lhr-like helicase
LNPGRPAANLSPVHALDFAHPATRQWFADAFAGPTPAQVQGWGPIARGESTLLLAPTGSGKTLAAFLVALDRLCFGPPRRPAHSKNDRPGVRVLYVSPLKALGVDVERNLRAPLAGLASQADRLGVAWHPPSVGVRTGDTPAAERARLARRPPDILITTPESLYLWLTSEAAATLSDVETVIVDEIHALVPTKRGAHLALSLERLEALRTQAGNLRPLQRIGLSATQRPLEEVARFLGGAAPSPEDPDRFVPRAVTIVDASAPKRLNLVVDLPVEAQLAAGGTAWAADAAADAPRTRSIWPAIYPQLLALIRAHRTTLLFVNSRRLAERISGALNELAGEEVARAHHGSVSREARQEIEERLKAGLLPALLATSTLELGIDMGTVDLVVQIEAPLSVASALQRIGRAAHHVGGVSAGHFFPKYRGDLLACAAVTARMDQGLVEETRYPRNPLDVLTQQIVATVAMGDLDVSALYALVRGAAPFVDLPVALFEGVLDLLSGRYPTQALGSLTDARPALVRDPVADRLTARSHAKRLAVLNGGTIPDRGMYGVFLVDRAGGGDAENPGRPTSRRVGELDEEMVLESRPGEVFVLGASSWRIEEITFDRVLVSPAGAEPGKMPFWRGEGEGRAMALGEAMGGLSRALEALPRAKAQRKLVDEHHLGAPAADVLLDYLTTQRDATGEVPTDTHLIVERFRDEIGDWRVCVLSPYGARVHAAWVTAVSGRLRAQVPGEVEMFWTNDGFAFRLPEQETLPDLSVLFPSPEEVEDLVVGHLAETSLFAARFRENAARALLLPKRDPRRRTALWQVRKRAQDLMAAALEFPAFPIVLETYRECLRDAYDVPALAQILGRVRRREIRVTHVETPRPSPFAGSLLFGYMANFLYDGDQPVSERRARALTLDQGRLRALLGEAELREIFRPDEIAAVEARLQRLAPRHRCTDAEGLHDLLWRLGDLSRAEIHARVEAEEAQIDAYLDDLIARRRIVGIGLGGARRLIVVEDVARYRDALGVVPPPGTPVVYLEPAPMPLVDLVARYARTHGPFVSTEAAARLGTGRALVEDALGRLCAADRVVCGAFRPDRAGVEYCDAEVLRTLKRHALARLRQAVEPVTPEAYARFLIDWQGITRPRRGAEGLLQVISQLQGAAVPVSVLEAEVLPARVADYRPAMLDAVCIAGEVVWRGVESIGDTDGRIALYLTDHAPRLAPRVEPLVGPLYDRIRGALGARGASFFADLSRAIGGFPRDLEAALWALTWNGEVTNDTLAPLRSRLRGAPKPGGRGRRAMSSPFGGFASRRTASPGTEGRFSLVVSMDADSADETLRAHATCVQALERDGVLMREANLGGAFDFSRLYPVLKAQEETGRLRRGYFVEGLGATQFALPGAEERLRGHREPDDAAPARVLAACDPANPWGAALAWPRAGEGRLQRAAGCRVVLGEGRLLAWVGRGARTLVLGPLLPEGPAERHAHVRMVALALAAAVEAGCLPAFTLAEIDGAPADETPFAGAFASAGFLVSRLGLVKRRVGAAPPLDESAEPDEAEDADADAGDA